MIKFSFSQLNPKNFFTPGIGAPLAVLSKKISLISLEKKIFDDQLKLTIGSMLDIDNARTNEKIPGSLYSLNSEYNLYDNVLCIAGITKIKRRDDHTDGEDYRFKFLSNVIAKALHDIQPIINQDANYDYIDIKDFCRLCFSLALNEETYKYDSVNVCSGEPKLLSSYVDEILTLSGKEGLAFKINSDQIGREYSGSNNRLKEIQCSNIKLTSTKDTLGRLIRYYKERKEDLDKDALIKEDYIGYAKKIMRNKII